MGLELFISYPDAKKPPKRLPHSLKAKGGAAATAFMRLERRGASDALVAFELLPVELLAQRQGVVL